MYLINVVKAVKPYLSKKDYDWILEKLNANNETQLLRFITHQWYDALHLSTYLNERLLIVKKTSKGTFNLYSVVYDSRSYQSDIEALSIWLLYKDALIPIADVKELPILSNLQYNNQFSQPLATIFELGNQDIQDPGDVRELSGWMAKHVHNYPKKILFFHVLMYQKRCERGFDYSDTFGTLDAKETIYIEIICSRDYHLAFRKKDPRDPKEVEKSEKEQQECLDWYEKLKMRYPKSLKEAVNRSASVTTNLPVLTLAEKLSLLNQDEAEQISHAISQTTIALSCQYDEKNHLRYVKYKNKNKTFGVDLPCFDLNSDPFDASKLTAYKKMNLFFKDLYQQKSSLVKEKEHILRILLERLEPYPKEMKSHYSSCTKQLKDVIAKQIVVLYCEVDKDFQHLKYFLAHFFNCMDKPKKKCLVSLKMRQDNTITAISADNMTFYNLQELVDCKHNDFYSVELKATSFYDEEWIKLPRLLCHTQLKKQPEGYDNLSDLVYRANIQNKAMLEMYHKIRKYVYTTFGIDPFIKGHYKSLSMIGYELALINSANLYGPYEMGLEKTKSFYHDLYRQSCKGGFMYSSFCELKVNDYLYSEGGSVAKSLYHYDLNSAYGYSASKALMPNGFAVGYAKPSLEVDPPKSLYDSDDEMLFDLSDLCLDKEPEDVSVSKKMKPERLQRQDGSRYHSFEFQAVYTTIFRLLQKGINIKVAFHNFTTFGIFYVDKYPLDLVVIDSQGKWLGFNFDGQFFHGCTICKPLQRYVNDQNLMDLRKKDKNRDVAILKFTSSHPNAIYQTFTDCHDPMYQKKEMHKQIMSEPILKQLIDHYPRTTTFDKDSFMDFVRQNRHNDNFTFVCWIKGSLDQPLFIIRREELPTRDELSKITTKSQSLLLTRQYLEFLLDSGNLTIDDLDAIIFYQTRKPLNAVYDELVRKRYSTTDVHLNSFLKRLINLSCGLFGSNYRPRINVSIRNSLPANYKIYKHQIDANMLHCSQDVGKENYFHFKTIISPSPKRPQCKVPLPWFVTIIEHSKLRIIQCLHFLNIHFGPQNVKLIYSNVDNLVIALAGNSLVESVLPFREWSFINHLEDFIYHEKLPGLLKKEWSYHQEHNWKVVTCRIQHLVVVSEEAHLKTSGIKFDSPEEAYETGVKMLHGIKTLVTQQCRVNRIAGLETEERQLYI